MLKITILGQNTTGMTCSSFSCQNTVIVPKVKVEYHGEGQNCKGEHPIMIIHPHDKDVKCPKDEEGSGCVSWTKIQQANIGIIF